ncbi:MAG TPA: GDSL-type esterase/lipase family protein [Solirubrobacteraceae bacterium]|jgi:lysophospholipase L1-like esterase|nr:GDSL-type esterase/lipase family protein [Solirubrobacteraceae bacterium]
MTTTDRDPFILDRPTARRLRARDAIICVLVAVVLLLLLEGKSIRRSGERMEPGIERTIVLAVGKPAGWLADRLPLADAVNDATAWLSPDEQVTDGAGAFQTPPAGVDATASRSGGSAPITEDAFDRAALGEPPQRLDRLATLLVTGDSLAQPLDVELARRLAPQGVRTIREARLGTGISKSDLVDWGQLSVQQTRERSPDAVVMFIGANEGFPFPGSAGTQVDCCGPAWAVQYATRARRMMDTYRRDGAARVYWLTLPMPREATRQRIARAVNAAILVAAQPFRSHVRVLDMNALFTPGGRYRAAMPVGGRQTIVREADGIHLNDAGARLAADVVLGRLRADFASLGS